MSFSNSLLVHAMQLFKAEHSGVRQDEMLEVCRRRAISAAYYALFHHLNSAAVDLIAPHVGPETKYRIQRWFDHGEMKRVCGRFVAATLDKPLLHLIGKTTPPKLRYVAQSFIALQEARLSADYDLSYILSVEDADRLLRQTTVAMAYWDDISTTAEANIFILSLLLWKNWDKER